MNFSQSISHCFSNYANFKGRASRSEFWWFFLFVTILEFGADIWDASVGHGENGFYIWIVIASAVLSWLVAFDVVNMRNRFIFMIGDALNRLTEPVYARIRRFLPDMGGLDLSPLIVIFGLIFLRNLMWEVLGPSVYGG